MSYRVSFFTCRTLSSSSINGVYLELSSSLTTQYLYDLLRSKKAAGSTIGLVAWGYWGGSNFWSDSCLLINPATVHQSTFELLGASDSDFTRSVEVFCKETVKCVEGGLTVGILSSPHLLITQYLYNLFRSKTLTVEPMGSLARNYGAFF